MRKDRPASEGHPQEGTARMPTCANSEESPGFLPDHDRRIVYGRLLESIFADPRYREVLYNVAMKVRGGS